MATSSHEPVVLLWERVILLGREDDWSREHRHAFECSGCTKTVTLADRVDGAAYSMKSLLRSRIKSLNVGP